MKKILKSALVLLGGLCLMVACSDDRDSNPTLYSVNTFTLNRPTFSAGTVALAQSEALPFTWSQPGYGFPVACQYVLQFSADGEFTKSLAEADADETGATRANYGELATSFVTPEAQVDPNDLATLLERICQWAEDAVPATQTVYARVLSFVNGAANVDSVYSNVVSFTVEPYYVALKAAEPLIWYLIGGTIGDGTWSNSAAGLGTSIQPMYVLPGEEYDKATGEGKIGYTGYFIASQGFKFIRDLGSWDEQIGTTDGALSPVRNDGGSSNFFVPEDGYYKIVFNTSTECDVTIEKYEDAPAAWDILSITGGFNDWNKDDTAYDMRPIHTFAGAVNHDWYIDFQATADTEGKFLTNHDWGVNWGATDFPRGFGVGNGPNIPIAAGNYSVFFNDITGTYTFIAK